MGGSYLAPWGLNEGCGQLEQNSFKLYAYECVLTYYNILSQRSETNAGCKLNWNKH